MSPSARTRKSSIQPSSRETLTFSNRSFVSTVPKARNDRPKFVTSTSAVLMPMVWIISGATAIAPSPGVALVFALTGTRSMPQIGQEPFGSVEM